MAKDKTRQTLNELLVDLFNFILRIEEKYLQARGLKITMSEMHIIETVDKIKNNTVTNIADAMLVTKGTFSINTSRMIKKGYLIKYRDEKDGRVVRVEITDKAREALKIHKKFHENLIDKTVEDLNLTEKDALNKGLDAILQYFKTEYKNIREKSDYYKDK